MVSSAHKFHHIISIHNPVWNQEWRDNVNYWIRFLNWTFIDPSVQFSLVAQSCPTLCDPMDCITPGLPVHHQLLEPTKTHVHWVGDAIQPSHPLSSSSPPALNLSQHQGLFKLKLQDMWTHSDVTYTCPDIRHFHLFSNITQILIDPGIEILKIRLLSPTWI